MQKEKKITKGHPQIKDSFYMVEEKISRIFKNQNYLINQHHHIKQEKKQGIKDSVSMRKNLRIAKVSDHSISATNRKPHLISPTIFEQIIIFINFEQILKNSIKK